MNIMRFFKVIYCIGALHPQSSAKVIVVKCTSYQLFSHVDIEPKLQYYEELNGIRTHDLLLQSWRLYHLATEFLFIKWTIHVLSIDESIDEKKKTF